MTHLTPEEVEMIEREAWEVWEKDQKTNPTPVNPHAFVCGYRIAAAQLKAERELMFGLKEELDNTINLLYTERERAGKLMEALEEIVNPTGAMIKRLKPGESLNGVCAMQLSDDANYLKNIAQTAITEYKNNQ